MTAVGQAETSEILDGSIDFSCKMDAAVVSSSWNVSSLCENLMSGIGPEQLAEVFERDVPALRLYAAQLTNWPDDAVQEAVLRLVRLTEPPENPKAWLYRVVRQRALNLSRGESRRTQHEESAATQRSGWFEPDLDGSMESLEVKDALASLASQLREVVVLRLWSHSTFGEIAELTDVSEATACRRYQTAIEQLKRNLLPGTIHE